MMTPLLASNSKLGHIKNKKNSKSWAVASKFNKSAHKSKKFKYFLKPIKRVSKTTGFCVDFKTVEKL
jgi:hypothetical protein